MVDSSLRVAKMAPMQKLLIATLLLSCAVSCSEEPPPPKPKKAPDSKPVAKTPDLPTPPPPPPPTQEPEKPKPQAPAPKVLLDPTLPEWSQTAPAEFKAKFSTTKG